MRTDELVKLLASGAGAIDEKLPARRFGIAVGLGMVGATLLMVTLLGVRPDLARSAAGDTMFWVKLAFAALLAAGSLAAAFRLSRPGVRLARLPSALAAPLLAMWVLAAFVLIDAAPAQRAALVLGQTWKSCPFNIVLLSIPVFVAMVWAMKGLAPTRLRLAGAAAGLAASTLGATVYTLHCPELAAPFLGTWYVIGMLIPAAAGALIGPRVLRW